MKIIKTVPLLLAGVGAVAPAQGQAPVRATLVKDFNTAPAEVGSTPRGFFAADGKVYFSATRTQNGRELFAIDAPGGQPYLAADLAPGGASSHPAVMGVAGGKLIVQAWAGNTLPDDQLGASVAATYALDPASGERTLLTGLRSYPVGGFGNKMLLYTLEDNTLLATGGTPETTRRLLQGAPGDDLSVPWDEDRVCRLHDRFMFIARRGGVWQLWLSNGETLGTGVVTTLPEVYPIRARGHGGDCYFLSHRNGDGWDLWLSNGTAGGTGVVASSADGHPVDLVVLDDGTPLLMDTLLGRTKLWRIGTALPLLDVEGNGHSMHAAGSRVLFDVHTPSAASVYVSDGTPAGTQGVMQADGTPLLLGDAGADAIADSRFAVVGETALTSDFSTAWRIDLATARASSYAAPALIDFSDSATLGGVALGAAPEGYSGSELWRSDGSVAGTQLVADLATATANGVEFGEAVALGNVLVLSHVGVSGIFSFQHHGELWRTDGSAAGTWALPAQAYGGGSVEQVRTVGQDILFSVDAQPSSGLRQLYRTRSDFLETQALPATTLINPAFMHTAGQNGAALFICGQPAGQHDLCAVGAQDNQIATLQYALPGDPHHVGSVGNLALYSVSAQWAWPEPNEGLFRSDGTAPGTWLLRRGLVARAPSASLVQASGTRLLFQGRESGQTGWDLWISDGTPGGTASLAAINVAINAFAQLGDRMLFITAAPRNELWVTDGTAAGTRLVTQLSAEVTHMIAAGGYVHMSRPRIWGDTYIVSDGTSAGTRDVPRPSSLHPSYGEASVALDANTVVFGCSHIERGSELCAIDADGGNLRPAVDLYPGPTGSEPLFVARTADAAYFSADDGVHGRELWRVTAPGNTIFADGFD